MSRGTSSRGTSSSGYDGLLSFAEELVNFPGWGLSHDHQLFLNGLQPFGEVAEPSSLVEVD
jgi:hypothetical protein